MPADGSDASRDGLRATLVTVSVAITVVGLLATGATAGVVTGADFDTPDPQVSTHGNLQETVAICGQSALPLVSSYNDRIADVPWFVKTAVSGKVIHGVVHNDTIGNYTVETGSEGTIQSLAAGTPAAPGIRVITYCDSFVRISAASDPVSQFWLEYENDRVRIVGLGFANWLLVGLLTNPLLAAGISLMFLVLAGGLYYYIRRRQMTQKGLVPIDEGSE